MPAVWDRVQELLLHGKDPTITLSYAALVTQEPVGRGRWRRKPHLLADTERMAANVLGKSVRRRCANPHCRKRVGKKFVCSGACADVALKYYVAAVDVLSKLTNEDCLGDNVPLYRDSLEQ